jgi:molybdopterin converting factor small subunit
MVKVKLEIWMRLAKELGNDFLSPSDMCSIRQEEVKDGLTVRDFFDDLAKRYEPIRKKIFGSEKNAFYPDVVVTLNDRVISPPELFGRVLKDGDKITVVPMFAGG